jgi:hypothetical protein
MIIIITIIIIMITKCLKSYMHNHLCAGEKIVPFAQIRYTD